MLQQKTDAQDLDLTSLTLKEPSSPVEELVTTVSNAKVNLQMNLWTTVFSLWLHPLHSYVRLYLVSLPACPAVLLCV